MSLSELKKPKNLIKFTLDDGIHRVILSGIHEYYEAEKLHCLMVDPHIPAGAKLY